MTEGFCSSFVALARVRVRLRAAKVKLGQGFALASPFWLSEVLHDLPISGRSLFGLEAVENRFDDFGLHDDGDPLHLASAAWAFHDIYAKDP